MNALSRLGTADGGVERAHRGSVASGFHLPSSVLRLSGWFRPVRRNRDLHHRGAPGHLAHPNPSQSLDRSTSGLLPSRARGLSG